MSLFGYPAIVKHYKANIDSWGRVNGYQAPIEKAAKVIEEQKLIRNAKNEEVQSIAEIHIEGLQNIGTHDKFEYYNGLGVTVEYMVKHIEIKKTMGTDNVKKVIVYA